MSYFYRIYRNHLLIFTKFSLVGLTTAIIYFLALWVFKSLKINYLIAVTFAYAVCNLFHFFMNRRISFHSVLEKYHRQFARYLVIVILNYFIVIVVVGFCVEKLRFSPEMGSCSSIVFTSVLSYILSRYWVFKKSKME